MLGGLVVPGKGPIFSASLPFLHLTACRPIHRDSGYLNIVNSVR